MIKDYGLKPQITQKDYEDSIEIIVKFQKNPKRKHGFRKLETVLFCFERLKAYTKKTRKYGL